VRARIIVMAKAPAAGRSKTRLCPPLTLEQAAALAEASLVDTLRAAAAAGGRRPVVALDGEPGSWLPEGFDIVPQRGHGLASRLSGAFEDVAGPALLIGMDTPQVTPELLRASCLVLEADGCDAALGPALDGGWWALGLRRPDPCVFQGVPMSTPFTGAMQRCRLADLGLRYRTLPVLRDVDRMDDALAVAEDVPRSGFADAVRLVLADASLARTG
jgi:uncharacterized protein